jgi:hypothetical protein
LSESEVAELLDVAPWQVQGYLKLAIDHLVANGAVSVPINWQSA